MPVRGTMAALIARTRSKINDLLPLGSGQIFADQEVQDALDACRLDLYNAPCKPMATFSAGVITYLDYFGPNSLTDWEDDLILKQFLTTVVSPSTTDNIVGHWQFAATTVPPVFITGKTFDLYRASADLLERWAAKWALSYNMSVDGQSLQRGMALTALLDLAKTYRLQQRASGLALTRSDLAGGERRVIGLGANELDYMGSG